MFFFFVFFAIGFLLTAFMSPKMKTENAKAATLDDFSFPRADEGDPVPRFYGTLKNTSPNTIAISNFKTVPIKKKVKTGLFSSKKIITGYKYYMTVDLAWALGPGVIFRKMWFGENLVWTGCLYVEDCVNFIPINLPTLYGGKEDGSRGGIIGTVAMYCGNFDQPRNAVTVSAYGADVPAYVGVAHTVFQNFYWGNQSQVDAVAMELVYGTDDALGIGMGRVFMPNGLDINCVSALHDIMTYGWGNLGYDPDKINVTTWRSVAGRIYSEGNGISLSVANSTQAADAIKTILRQMNATMYEDASTGLVELKLIRNDYVIADLPVLGPSEITEVRSFTKKLWSETTNVVRLKYIDRDAGYIADKIATAKDSSLLRFQGRERPVEVNMPGVKTASLANTLAARELSNMNIPLYTAQLTCNREAITLHPGDPFVLNWPEYNVDLMVMRIQKMGMGTLESGAIALDVVQDQFSSDAVVISAPVPPIVDYPSLTPLDIVDFRIFELPYWLDYAAGDATRVGYTRLASFAHAPSDYTLGYDAYIQAGGDDAEVLSVAPYTNFSTLTYGIPRFAGWEDGNLPEVIIALPTVPSEVEALQDPRLGGGMLLIGDELFNYTTAADNLDGTWTLGDVKRAVLDTGWFEHAVGAIIFFFDGQEGFFETDSLNDITESVYLLDHTSSGQSSTADAVVTAFHNVGRIEKPIAPDFLKANGDRALNQMFAVGDTVTIDGFTRNRFSLAQVWYEDDASITPEPGTLYKIQVEVGGVVTDVADDETLPYDLLTTIDMAGNCVVLVSAKRDGVLSYSPAPMPIVIDTEFLTIDYDVVYVDDEGIEF